MSGESTSNEVLFVRDLARELGLSRSAVRRLLRRGELGPFMKIGRRYAVVRSSFVGALRQRETAAVATSVPSLSGRARVFQEKLRT